jgi:hypothetical protein
MIPKPLELPMQTPTPMGILTEIQILTVMQMAMKMPTEA